MSQPILAQVFEQLTGAISLCFEKRLITPALMLLYSGIDVAGWLHTDNPTESVRERFTQWVERYLLPGTPLKCTALELYAARCGVVHSFSPEAGLTQDGKARKIIYAWGTSRVESLDNLIALGKMRDYVAIQLEDLIAGFTVALGAFLKDLDADPKRRAQAEGRAKKVFTTLSEQDAQNLLRWGKTLLDGE